MGQYPKVVFRLLDCVQSCSAFGFWGLVEMALIMKKLCLCNKMKGGQDFYVTKIVTVWLATDTKQLLNRCQAVKNRIGGDQPLFDQSDLYVIPEALIYEIFGGILSSMPSSSE